MKEQNNSVRASRSDMAIAILTVGAGWGIFEATVGYLLHLLPVSVGFLVWYPVAVFFLMTAYRVTQKRSAVLLTALLAASIKLLNLLLPGRIDRVINPAVSIVFEALAVCLAITLLSRMKREGRVGATLGVSIGMNTAWRLLFLGYLAFLVPAWIREASVLVSSAKLVRFLVIDNLCSSAIVWIGLLLEERLAGFGSGVSRALRKTRGVARVLVPGALLALNILLQMTL